jgi:hypothetical protein
MRSVVTLGTVRELMVEWFFATTKNNNQQKRKKEKIWQQQQQQRLRARVAIFSKKSLDMMMR